MGKIIDLTGKKFGRWEVKGISHQKKSMVYWLCVCECGTERAVFGGDLKRSSSVSCGCFMREATIARFTSHDMARHPAYASWKHMKSRCMSPSNDGYKDYGGRGVSVCQEWIAFEGFWKDMGDTWREGLSIDRYPDVNGNYEPGNCRWATPKEQGNNRRTNVMVKGPNGEPMTVTQASEAYGIDRRAVYSRIRYGWPESDWFLPTRK